MHDHHGHLTGQHPHIEALRAKHAMLAKQIEDVQKSPAANESHLRQLKMRKLKVKDEINRHRTG